jgi:hypothetical protein
LGRGPGESGNSRETKFPNGRFGGGKCRFGGAGNGFETVAEYRLYGLDGVNKVASGEWFEAENDQAAIEIATQMMDGKDCELWAGKRFVTRIPRKHGPSRDR